ncbi:hypothetical protein SFRURICE_002098 [Spodoptera frugiperda]|nr:hypothetical protein SFRURICE_002098 [Spodoptera frugiperda]
MQNIDKECGLFWVSTCFKSFVSKNRIKACFRHGPREPMPRSAPAPIVCRRLNGVMGHVMKICGKRRCDEAATISVVLVLVLLVSWISLVRESRRFNVNGPMPLPIIGNAHMFIAKSTEFLNVITRYSEKYGKVFRVHFLSVPTVIVCDAKFAQEIVSSQEHISKGGPYQLLECWLGKGLLTATGQRWKSHRRFLTPAFHFNILQNFLPVFCKNQRVLTEKLRELADGRPVDMFPIFALAALDNVTESIMGTSVDAQGHERESAYVKSIEVMSTTVAMRIQIPIFGPDVVFNLTPYKSNQTKALKVLHEHSRRVIEERRQELKKANITSLNASNDGHDTTTSGLSYALYCLSKRRYVQDKIYEELQTIFGDDMERDPTYQELGQMKYLELVLKESMRLYPPVPFIERCITKDCEIGGIKMVKGTSVFLNIFQIQRQPDMFEDPLEFRPERFEEALKNPFSFLAFSAGPRNCIGQKFAMMELKVTISEIVKHFYILPVDETPQLSSDLVLRSKNGINVSLVRESRRFNVNGPMPLPIIGNAHMFISKSTEFLNLLAKYSEQYGKAYRVHFLSVPYDVASSQELIFKGGPYSLMTCWLGQGLLTSAGQRWKSHRKFLTPAFHFNILQNFLPVFCKNQRNPLWVPASMLKDTKASQPMMSAILAMRIQIPILGPDAIFNLTPMKNRQIKALKVLHGHSTKVIETRRQELKKANITTLDTSNDTGIRNKHAFLDLLLLGEIDGKKIDDESVREEVDTFMFEGHDTTTSGISYTLYCLSKRRDVQEKVYEELKTIFGDDMERDPTYQELGQMKYLELVLKESMRLYPPVPLIERRITRDCEVGGLKLVKGTSVVLNIYQIQRQPDMFEDPLEFRPERFEEALKNPFSFLAFSAGPRNCIGQKFAMMELKITISEIVKHFYILPVDEAPQLSADLILRSKNGINVKFMPRK